MRIYFSRKKIFYADKNGALQPVNPGLKPQEDQWCAAEQEFPTYLFKDGSTALSAPVKLIFNRNCSVNGQPLSMANAEAGEDGMYISSAVPNIDKVILFGENRVESDYIIQQKQLFTGAYFQAEEEILLPDGAKLAYDTENGKYADGSWQGDVVARDAGGREIARFRMPLVFDADHKYEKGSYTIKRSGENYILQTRIPAQWLNDPQRLFPIVIDPLVTGPTTTWAGGTMPSCILPSYNSDSILITVPPAITVTALMVQSSYYADPFTTAVMADGRMYFRTTCGSTTVLSVSGNQGNQPGTAYLQYTNYRSPLMCCHPAQCSGYTFWLLMRLGRVQGGAGCNTTYIRYDPFTTSWPFSGYIEGHTIENINNVWTINPTTICSDQCQLNMSVTARYGVPPFTLTHPWLSGPVTIGTPSTACGINNNTFNVTLTVPGCPTYCGNTQNLSVPAPVITDACGNTTLFVAKPVTVNPTPTVTATPTSLAVCSGDPLNITLTTCGSATVSWNGDNSSSGTGSINTILTTTSPITVNYTATATQNGCTSPPVTIPVNVNPYPVPDAGTYDSIYQYTSTTLNGTGGGTYLWSPAYGLSCTTCANPVASPSTTTTYTLTVTSNGCTATDTVTIFVIDVPYHVFVPNCFTPNGNGVNETFSPVTLGVGDIHWMVFDRWGELLFEAKDLVTVWDGTYQGKKIPSGVYVWLLDATPLDLHYQPVTMTGTVTVLKKGK